MWFDGIRQPNTIYAASVSRGKDSTAMLRAIQLMRWPLDVVYSCDVFFDDETPAELPPMVDFKDKWDAKCEQIFGIPVTRLCATTTADKKYQPTFSLAQRTDGANASSTERVKLTYCDIFYRKVSQDIERERVAMRQKQLRQFRNLRTPDAFRKLVSIESQNLSPYGFPNQKFRWCTGELKTRLTTDSLSLRGAMVHWSQDKLFTGFRGNSDESDGVKTNSNTKDCGRHKSSLFSEKHPERGAKTKIVHYIGIAADEEKRVNRHIDAKNKVLPLVQIGWDEYLCGLEATYLDMLSPTYESSSRDGCWFCHNQRIDSLRHLRHNYPELWSKLMAIDLDSPVTFHADGRTVHDFDRRFQAEEDGLVPVNRTFKWAMLDDPKLTFESIMKEDT